MPNSSRDWRLRVAVRSYQCSPEAIPAADDVFAWVGVGLEWVIGVFSVGSGVTGLVEPREVAELRWVGCE